VPTGDESGSPSRLPIAAACLGVAALLCFAFVGYSWWVNASTPYDPRAVEGPLGMGGIFLAFVALCIGVACAAGAVRCYFHGED